MLRYFFAGLLFFVACDSAKPVDEQLALEDVSEWVVYEGRIPLSDVENLYMEISMKARGAGEGSYVLHERMEGETETRDLGSFKGNYSTFSTAEGSIEIYFQNSSYETGVKRSYRSPDGKRIREERYRVRDLSVRKDGDYRLVVLDHANDPISMDENHNLSKRTSIIFTVEGKFAPVGDTSVFYEMNTNQAWSVSKQGSYYEAARQYHQLAKAKNEGVYLKGTAFSIRVISQEGKQYESLVFKKIITMTSAPVSE